MRLHFDEWWMRLLASGKRIASIGMIELAERHRFPGTGSRAFFGILAEKFEYAGDAASLALGREERRAVGDLTFEHAHDRHLAPVRGVQRLQHVGDRLGTG